MSLRGGSGRAPSAIPPLWGGSVEAYFYGDYIAVPGKGLELKNPAAKETAEGKKMKEKSREQARS